MERVTRISQLIDSPYVCRNGRHVIKTLGRNFENLVKNGQEVWGERGSPFNKPNDWHWNILYIVVDRGGISQVERQLVLNLMLLIEPTSTETTVHEVVRGIFRVLDIEDDTTNEPLLQYKPEPNPEPPTLNELLNGDWVLDS